MKAMVRYYSTQRPVGPGTFPKPVGNKVAEIHNYDSKTFCEEIGREAWGYIGYEQPLTPREAERYELTMAGLKLFWCVTSGFDDYGRIVAHITQTVEALEKPENSYKHTSRKDIYNDWFSSLEDAEKFVEQSKQA